MAYISEGTGKLKPTGKAAPETGVRVSISHEVLENVIGGQKMKLNKTVVHNIVPQNGDSLPPGDFDLVVCDRLIRLKKVANNPEWVVLSSYQA